MAEYPVENIQEITKNEIIYFDNSKKVHRIDLLQCHNNWKKRDNVFKRLLYSIQGHYRIAKYVGIRHLGEGYYQLWDVEKTTFIITIPDDVTNREDIYTIQRYLENRLSSFSWHTLDMS